MRLHFNLTFRSYRLRAPRQFTWKSSQKGNFYRKLREPSCTCGTPPATSYTNRWHRSTLYTPAFTPCRSDPWLPEILPTGLRPCLAVFRIFSPISCPDFNMSNLWRKFALFQLVPRAHYAPHRAHFLTWIVTHSCSTPCENFTPLLVAVWLRISSMDTVSGPRPQTDMQTHSPQIVI